MLGLDPRRFGATVEVTASERRGEMLFPVDDASDTFSQSLASSSVGIAAAIPAQSVGGAAKDGSDR
jgi:hypothetical protein